ncbi:MAG: hypothetical protein HKN18_09465 [Silicimonas sp.]|nr:hypothetical protein [Silicimonas sp.]
MCEFKYCRGSGACFLNGSSPCPSRADSCQLGGQTTRAVRSLGLRYDGFLDRDDLIAALDLDNTAGPVGYLPEVVEIIRKRSIRAMIRKREDHRDVA